MKNKTIVAWSSLVIFVVLVFSIVVWIFSIINTEISLRYQYEATQNQVETTLDKMRKLIMNEYKVTKDFADAFIQVVQAQSEGRKGGSGGAMVSAKVNRESEKLGITSDMYIRMNNTISGILSEYKNAQDKLTDIWREHNSFCSKMPNALIVGSKVVLVKKPEMISSDTVKRAIETKKLDDKLL